jgi:hypothetical protein
MKRLSLLMALLAPLAAHAQQGDGGPAPLNCDVGPITKPFGGTDWIVYSCSDDATLVLMAIPPSPAAPFYLMFYFSPEEQGYRLYGEGTGDKKATDDAFAELSALPASAIIALLQETRAADVADQ